MDKIIIRDLLLRGIIGVNEGERETPQDILVNVELYADLHLACISDKIEDTIDYSSIATLIQKHVESIQRFTVECLAEDITRICLEDSRVERVLVRVEKPDAIMLAKHVGVEIERTRHIPV